MSKKEDDLKEMYNKMLTDNEQKKVCEEDSKPKATPKGIFNNCLNLIKSQYLPFEMIVVGFLLLCLGFVPAIKIISYEFLETLNVSVSFFDVAGWIFNVSQLSATNVFLSLFSLLYIASSFACIILGILILLNVIKKEHFLICSIMHFVTIFLLMGFFVTFAVWMGARQDSNLIATGIDIIYYNFSTAKIYTLIYFNLAVVMIAYTAVYIYHNRKSIFK